MPFEGASQFPSMQIPEFDSFVPTATDKCLPIRTEGNASNPLGMPSKGYLSVP
jgi:hypothetical protein